MAAISLNRGTKTRAVKLWPSLGGTLRVVGALAAAAIMFAVVRLAAIEWQWTWYTAAMKKPSFQPMFFGIFAGLTLLAAKPEWSKIIAAELIGSIFGALWPLIDAMPEAPAPSPPAAAVAPAVPDPMAGTGPAPSKVAPSMPPSGQSRAMATPP